MDIYCADSAKGLDKFNFNVMLIWFSNFVFALEQFIVYVYIGNVINDSVSAFSYSQAVMGMTLYERMTTF